MVHVHNDKYQINKDEAQRLAIAPLKDIQDKGIKTRNEFEERTTDDIDQNA